MPPGTQAVADQLRNDYNIDVNSDWLEQCLGHICGHVPGFEHMPQQQRLTYILDQLLVADLHACAQGGGLPDVQVVVRALGPYLGGVGASSVMMPGAACTSIHAEPRMPTHMRALPRLPCRACMQRCWKATTCCNWMR